MKAQAKKYYYNLQLEEIDKITESGRKPRLLMHTCCAMCACWPVLYLTQFFDLTLFYYNDNIYPQEEYDKRFSELSRYVCETNEKFNQNVKIIKTPYKGEEYIRNLELFGDSPEGGERCRLCYSLRLTEGMKYASENGYDYFCTVMTISRQKNSAVLNRIGEQLEKEYPDVRYFYSDFKKEGGLEKGEKLVKEYDIYRQNYCGCVFSWQEMLERARKTF